MYYLKTVVPAGEDCPALEGDDVGLFGRVQQLEVDEPLHAAKQNVCYFVQ